MTGTASHRYTGVAITLHWVMAILLLVMIWLGWNMDENESRYQLHKSIGITILLLTIARIVWRVMNPPPAEARGMSALESIAARAVHVGFYALMILLPLGGWLMVSVSPFQISTVLFGTVSWPHLPFTEHLRSEDLYETIEFFHGKGAWLIIGLLILHVAGAAKHELSTDEGVLKRMLPGLLGTGEKPAAPARGALLAFGSSLALFGLVAAAPLLSGPSKAPAVAPSAAPIEANWSVDYPASSITFSGVHDGKPFEGNFGKWTADVRFDPADLVNADVSVQIDTASAKTGKKLYDDSLGATEWFGVKTHPRASVRLRDFNSAEAGFTATASVQIKERTVDVPLSFTVDISNGVAALNGTAVLSRKALDLGQTSDPSANWVSDDVTIVLKGRATAK